MKHPCFRMKRLNMVSDVSAKVKHMHGIVCPGQAVHPFMQYGTEWVTCLEGGVGGGYASGERARRGEDAVGEAQELRLPTSTTQAVWETEGSHHRVVEHREGDDPEPEDGEPALEGDEDDEHEDKAEPEVRLYE